VELTVKDSALVKGLNAAKKRLESIGASITGVGLKIAALGAGMTAPFVGAVKQFTDVGSALNDMSARTGVSATILAELGYAAEQTGASMEDIETAIKRSQKAGLNFDTVAAEIAAIQDPAQKAARAIEVFGRSGTKLIPMIDDMARLRAEARSLGIVPSEAAVKLADDLGDAFGKVQKVVGAVFFELGAALAPVLLPAAEAVAKMGLAFINWIKNNQKTIQVVAALAVGVLALGTALVGIGGTITLLGTALGGIAAAITTLAPLFAFLISPIGLVTAGLVAGVAAWATWTTSGQAAVGALSAAFQRFGSFIGEVWGGIVDGLMAGDLEAAGRVAIAGLAVAFQVATADITKLWLQVKWAFLQTWTEATYGVAALFTKMYAGIQTGWVKVVATMQRLWNGLSNKFLETSEQVTGTLAKQGIDAAVSTNAMTKEDGEAQKAALDEDLAKAKANRQARFDAEKERINANEKQRLDEIASGRSGALGELDKMRQADTDKNTAAFAAGLKAKQDALAVARAGLGLARENAKAARDRREAAAMANGPHPADIAGGDDGALQRPKMPTISAGTFSAAGAVAAFGGSQGGIAQRTLEEMRAMRRLLAEMKKTADREWNQRKNDEAKMNIRFATGGI